MGTGWVITTAWRKYLPLGKYPRGAGLGVRCLLWVCGASSGREVPPLGVRWREQRSFLQSREPRALLRVGLTPVQLWVCHTLQRMCWRAGES